jgi:hypothetical protein
MYCPYCGHDKDASDFTYDHVIPRALGGNLRPTNPFKLPVCRRCNTLCGYFVDGPFVRSWFIHNARALAKHKYIDPESDILPLTFMGQSTEWPEQLEVCDFWLGPTGDHIYHFHEPYPSEPVMVGQPLGIPEESLDPGCVMVLIVASNPFWHSIIAKSIKDEFEKSSIHYLNAAPEGLVAPYPPIAISHTRHLEWVNSFKPDGMRHVKFTTDITCTDRFMMKVALGLGSLALAPDFIKSVEAEVLRKSLWTTDPKQRESLMIRGSSMFQQKPKYLTQILNWNDCHLIMLIPAKDTLFLMANFFGQHLNQIEVSRSPAHWEERIEQDGIAWIIAPGLRRFAGPITMPQFASQKSGFGIWGELKELQAHFDNAKKFPPFHLTE